MLIENAFFHFIFVQFMQFPVLDFGSTTFLSPSKIVTLPANIELRVSSLSSGFALVAELGGLVGWKRVGRAHLKQTHMADPGRKRTLFRCVFRSYHCVGNAISLDVH